MLFCVVVAINAFCYHSSGYCLLPPALFPPHTHIPQKNRRVWGFAWGAEGASPAESHICLQSSHSKTGGLPTSNFLNERLEHSCEELQRLKKAKFSSPKPPRASGKTSGFMKFQQALVRAGAAAWRRPWLPRENGFWQGSRGLLCSVGFSCRACGCFPCIQSWVRTIL